MIRSLLFICSLFSAWSFAQPVLDLKPLIKSGSLTEQEAQSAIQLSGTLRETQQKVIVIDAGGERLFFYYVDSGVFTDLFEWAEEERWYPHEHLIDLDNGTILKLSRTPNDDDNHIYEISRQTFPRVDLAQRLADLHPSILPYRHHFQGLLDTGELDPRSLFQTELNPVSPVDGPHSQTVLLMLSDLTGTTEPRFLSSRNLEPVPRAELNDLFQRCVFALGGKLRPAVVIRLSDGTQIQIP